MTSSKRKPSPSLRDASVKRDAASIDQHRIFVSFFTDASARELTAKTVTLDELAEIIESATASRKKRLPWLKLARFGEKRSVHGSLRHDDNVESITGIALDYDLEQISFEDAVEQLGSTGLRGLIYTSPSYGAERPRWRILLPTSCELPPEQHEGLARSAASLFTATFGKESFTLSQAFYYGTADKIETSDGEMVDGTLVDGTPVRIEIADGDFVDLAGLPVWTQDQKPKRSAAKAFKNGPPADRDEVILALAVIDADDYHDWLMIGAALHDEFGGDGFGMFDAWSQKSKKYNARTVLRKWQDCKDMTQYTVGSIFHAANRAAPGWRLKRRGSNGQLVLDPADPMRSARALYESQYLTRDGKNMLLRHRGEFFRWDGRCYRINDEETQRDEIWRFLDKAQIKNKDGGLVPFKPKKDHVSNIHEALGAICAVDNYIEPPDWIGDDTPIAPPREFFAAGNGLLHLPTRTLHEPTPSFFGVTASTVAHNPDAAPPTQWLAYLQETVADDQAISALQEWSGYCLGGGTSQQKILFCIGPKRSGKGTFARILTALLGKNSVGGPTMTSFGTQFGLAPLITKSLAIVSDARIGKKTDRAAITERLLTISGEDTIDIDRKYGTMWTGRLPTRIAILTNELPAFSEGSGALAGRFLVIMFQHSFFGREDPGLTDRLMTELPGILNWSIEGYERLQARGHFVQPTNALEQIEAIERLGNPVKAFVQDRCVVGPAREIDSDVLYDDWRTWCDDHGGQPGNKDWFGRNLRMAVPGLTTSRTTDPDANGQRRTVYRGVGVETPNPTWTAAYRLTQGARRSGAS